MKRINNTKNIKIRNKLMFSFLLLTIIPLAISGLISYFISSSSVESKVGSYSEELIRQLGQNILNESESTNLLISDTILDTQVQDLLEKYYSKEENDKGKILYSLKDQFTKKRRLFKNASQLLMFLNDGTIVEVGEQSGNQGEHLKIYDKLKEVSSNSAEGKLVLSFEKMSDSEYKFIFTRNVLNSDNKNMGVFYISMDTQYFNNLIDNMNVEGVQVYLCDKNGVIMSCKDKTKISQVFNEKELFNQISDENKVFVESSGDNKFLVKKIADYDWYVVFEIPYSFLKEDSNTIGRTIIIVSFLCILLAVGVSILITGQISKPLLKLVSAMNEARNGNLTVRVKDKCRDEIGRVIDSYNYMMDNICSFIEKVKTSEQDVFQTSKTIEDKSAHVLEASNNIASWMEAIAQGASSQAIDAADTVNSMEVLSKEINVISQQIVNVNSVIGDTMKLSENLTEISKDMNEKISNSSEVTERIVESIIDLNKEIQSITAIIKIIVDISNRTRMLSLNATIESAKVGEVGRGFSVIAENIKKLSDQSKGELSSIIGIISRIQGKSERSSKIASEARDLIEGQKESVNLTEDAVSVVFNHMKNLSRDSGVIKGSVENLIKSKDTALAAIESISAVCQQIAASTQNISVDTSEQSETSKSLAELSTQLKQLATELDKAILEFEI